MDPRKVGNNITRLLGAVDSWIHLETKHGVRREGRLSGWTCDTLKLNEVDIQLPIALELNGDPHDVVRLSDIKSLDLQSRKTDGK